MAPHIRALALVAPLLMFASCARGNDEESQEIAEELAFGAAGAWRSPFLTPCSHAHSLRRHHRETTTCWLTTDSFLCGRSR